MRSKRLNPIQFARQLFSPYVDRRGLHPFRLRGTDELWAMRLASELMYRRLAKRHSSRSVPNRLMVVLSAVLWCFILPAESTLAVSRAIREELRPFHKGIKDWFLMIWLGLSRNLDPQFFYRYRLFLSEQRRRYLWPSYVDSPRFAELSRYLQFVRGRRIHNLYDKDRFTGWCREKGLPHPHALEPGSLEKREQACFVKPSVDSHGGVGCYHIWPVKEASLDGWMVGKTFVPTGSLFTWLESHYGQTGFILQEALLAHPDLQRFSPRGALPTFRLLTCNGPAGVAIARVSLRFSLENEEVDNFTAGGACVAVDHSSGKFGQIYFRTVIPLSDVLPDGTRICGCPIPMWEVIAKLALDAHRAAGRHALLSWDVALTPTGPKLIECNPHGEIDILQLPHGAPLLEEPALSWLREEVQSTFV